MVIFLKHALEMIWRKPTDKNNLMRLRAKNDNQSAVAVRSELKHGTCEKKVYYNYNKTDVAATGIAMCESNTDADTD